MGFLKIFFDTQPTVKLLLQTHGTVPLPQRLLYTDVTAGNWQCRR